VDGFALNFMRRFLGEREDQVCVLLPVAKAKFQVPVAMQNVTQHSTQLLQQKFLQHLKCVENSTLSAKTISELCKCYLRST